IEVRIPSARVEHEATTSKISEDQLFYCRQRGIRDEDALSLIVNGFCREVLKELPMEFAVEAQKLLAVSLEGSVGGGPDFFLQKKGTTGVARPRLGLPESW